jgi:hypothetical protein
MVGISIDNSQFRTGVIDCLYSQLCEKCNKVIPQLERQVKEMVFDVISNDRTWVELNSPMGLARGYLGLDPSIDVNSIIKQFSEMVKVTADVSKVPFKGVINVGVLDRDMSNMLLQDNAVAVSPMGKTFNWLSFLLKSFQINNWHIITANKWESHNVSRSQDMIMKKGGSFQLPDYITFTMDRIIEELTVRLPQVLEQIII